MQFLLKFLAFITVVGLVVAVENGPTAAYVSSLPAWTPWALLGGFWAFLLLMLQRSRRRSRA